MIYETPKTFNECSRFTRAHIKGQGICILVLRYVSGNVHQQFMPEGK